MANTAKKIRKAADEAQSAAQSAIKDARSGLHDVADDMADQIDEVKRSPLAKTLLLILTLTLVGAVIMMIKNHEN